MQNNPQKVPSALTEPENYALKKNPNSLGHFITDDL